ncbi:Sas10 C-terminal domain-containing protein [Pseudoneurospora amorphoporcata]|uniref:Sas10 C-terminal domain-containing protein n=1 Tax=Pseudoneurospora amorphoporcata TaxID=241081 RepID=A0AAN6P051_9PEZI|nr:Sas10 C-terminal domain-containing protein [Pseudoneurospora amorphoporcata]
MAKKRKAPRPTGPAEPREVDAKDARLTVKTYKDVANSEDEYWEGQDRIDFDDSDDGRQSKRQRKDKEEEFLEASDEEVFEEEESDEESDHQDAAPAKAKKVKTTVLSDEEMGGEEEEEGDEGWWGSSRKDYYNADQIETEADALEEEAEAKRLQAKKLAKMSEADFAFDESEWLGTKEQAEEEEDVITEKLNEVEVTEDMGPEERYKLLQSRYPEFDYLAEEFRELQPILTTFQKEAEGKPAKSLEMVKFWTLGCYVASLASYFAILTSPARDSQGVSKTISPTELRDHEVMSTLMSCREAWLKVKELKPLKSVSSTSGMLSPPEDEGEFDDLSDDDMEDFKKLLKKNKRESKSELKAKAKKEAEKAKKARAVEQSLADLSNLLETTKTAAKASKKSAKADKRDDDERSDFGDEEILEAHVAKEKAARKKSLKFYTSQIVSKSAKRADAGRNAGGDDDIPYRERLRDRQARLNAEAEKRGKKGSTHGAALGEGDSDDEDRQVAKQVRGEEDEYYDMVAHNAAKKKEDKAAKYEALAAAKGARVVEETTVGADGKRQINYQIQKNKGLTPHRKKENRNPRVKKRMKYAEKQKKLKSVKAVYKGGEGKGGYQGELSGIKSNLVKSVKL